MKPGFMLRFSKQETSILLTVLFSSSRVGLESVLGSKAQGSPQACISRERGDSVCVCVCVCVYTGRPRPRRKKKDEGSLCIQHFQLREKRREREKDQFCNKEGEREKKISFVTKRRPGLSA